MASNNKRGQSRLGLVLFLILNSLLALAPSKDWQGYGNMSAQNLTEIWSFINSSFPAAVSADSAAGYISFSSDFSDRLNKVWDPAWNILTIKTVTSADAVLYGYAFRNHWMWYNGYVMGGKYYTFVIWKDYNCKNWVVAGETAFNGFSPTEVTDIINSRVPTAQNSYNDVWGSAKKFVDRLLQTNTFINSGVSLVLSQNAFSTFIYGKVCTVENRQNLNFTTFDNFSNGKYFLFQTRLAGE